MRFWGWVDFALTALKDTKSTATVLCMIGNNCCLLQLFAEYSKKKKAAARIPASGTTAKSTKEMAFQDSTHFAVDAHIHEADLQNPTQLLLLSGDTKCFSRKSCQATQFCYRVSQHQAAPCPDETTQNQNLTIHLSYL